LRRYLEFYKPKEAGRGASEASAQEPASSVAQPRREFNEKKAVALLKKKNEVDDEWGSVIGTSKPAKAPRGEAPKPKKAKDAPVNHIPEALAKFKFVEVDPPLLSSKIDSVLKALEEKHQFFKTLPDREVAEAEKKNEAKAQSTSAASSAASADNELEEGEIVEGDEPEEGEAKGHVAAEPLKAELTVQQAIAMTEEVLASVAVEDLTTSFAAATIHHVNNVADDDADGQEGEDTTPEQAAAMAALCEDIGLVVGEAQEALGEWVPPVAEKKPEHKDETSAEEPKKPDEAKPDEAKKADEPKAEAKAPAAAAEDEKPQAAASLTEIAQDTQQAVVAAVSKAVDAVAVAPETAAAEEEDEGEEGDEGEEEVEEEQAVVAVTPTPAAKPAPAAATAEEVEVVEYEEVEVEEGDEEEGDEEVEQTEAAQK